MADQSDLIDIEETLRAEQYKGLQHAVHAIIWAPWNGQVEYKYFTKAAVLMQLRFDGCFGFVGGLVDTTPSNQQDIVDALIKECTEEMNLNLKKFKFTTSDYLCTYKMTSPKRGLMLTHFYGLKVTFDDIREIEKDCLLLDDDSNEVFGIVRVPLHTMSDNRRGFPMFLNNRFIGSAKKELLYALRKLEILSVEEIDEGLSLAKKIADEK